MNYSKKDAYRAGLVFDVLANGPATKQQIAAAAELSEDQTRKAIHALRWILGDEDTINVVAEPNGARQPWLYRLVGTTEDHKWWCANRIGDAETRIGTLNQTCRSLVAATDGRTTPGKRARIIERHTRRCLEDLQELADVGTLSFPASDE